MLRKTLINLKDVSDVSNFSLYCKTKLLNIEPFGDSKQNIYIHEK